MPSLLQLQTRIFLRSKNIFTHLNIFLLGSFEASSKFSGQDERKASICEQENEGHSEQIGRKIASKDKFFRQLHPYDHIATNNLILVFSYIFNFINLIHEIQYLS